jgi:prepilin-type N-terminal cleavage/methylation domain-containing protein
MFRTNKNGFTLVEVAIVMGIMSIIALGVMKAFEMQAKSNRSERVNQRVDEFYGEVKALIERPGYCKSSASGLPLKNQKKVNFKAIKTPVNTVRYEVGKTPDGLVTLSEMYFSEFIPENEEGTSGLAEFIVVFEKQGKIFGSKRIEKKISMEVSLDEHGKIFDCAPIGTNSLTSSPKFDQADLEDSLNQLRGKPPTEAEMKAVIEKNPMLKKLQDQAKKIQEANKRFDKMAEDF